MILFPYTNKFRFDFFFFFKELNAKNLCCVNKIKFVTRNAQIEDMRGEAQGRTSFSLRLGGLLLGLQSLL